MKRADNLSTTTERTGHSNCQGDVQHPKLLIQTNKTLETLNCAAKKFERHPRNPLQLHAAFRHYALITTTKSFQLLLV